MNILAFSDLHENIKCLDTLKKKSKEVDIILCAGDFTIFEQGLRKMMKSISKFNKTTYLIHGNHENASNISKECKIYDNIRFIHKKIFRIKDITIFGYGGGGFAQIDKNFEEFIRKNKNKLSKKNILLTHAPPFDTSVDLISKTSAGSKSIRKFLKYFDLVICGHFHENFGKMDIIDKKTIVMNPGPDGQIIEL